jgi:outer membrane protein OmpA-like peptidoglycan-associated protein
MLMMGFFVILWVLKPPAGKQSPDAATDEKWLNTVGEIRKAFAYVPDPNSKDPIDVHMLTAKVGIVEPPFKGRGDGGETKQPPKSPKGTEALVTIVRPGKNVALGGRLGFAAGQATLRPETEAALDEVKQVIGGRLNIVLIKGHTALDDLPENATSQQRMDLSVRRAQAAADYLIAKGVLPEILRVQGCSTFEPVVQGVWGVDAQAPNRRVEIDATDQGVKERQDPPAPAKPVNPEHP